MDSTAPTLYGKITLSFPSSWGVQAQQQKGTQTLINHASLLQWSGGTKGQNITSGVGEGLQRLGELTAGGGGLSLLLNIPRLPQVPKGTCTDDTHTEILTRTYK